MIEAIPLSRALDAAAGVGPRFAGSGRCRIYLQPRNRAVARVAARDVGKRFLAAVTSPSCSLLLMSCQLRPAAAKLRDKSSGLLAVFQAVSPLPTFRFAGYPVFVAAEWAVYRGESQMKRFVCFVAAVATVAGVVAYMAPASGQSDGEAAPIYEIKIPVGYRDWELIAVNHLLVAGKADRAPLTRKRFGDQGLS